MARFPSTVVLTAAEAIEILAALEDAAATLARDGNLAGAVTVEDAAMVLTARMTEDWPDEDG